MMPTWVGVVVAISLAIIALAALAVAAASASAALGMRASLRMLQGLAGPALDDVRQLVGTVRAEVEGLAGTSRDLRRPGGEGHRRRRRSPRRARRARGRGAGGGGIGRAGHRRDA